MNKMLRELAETHRSKSEPGLATFSVSQVAGYSTLVLGLLVSLSVELIQTGRVSKTQGKRWLGLLRPKARAGWDPADPRQELVGTPTHPLSR